MELSVNLPLSSPIASVSALNVEPISNTPVVSRLMRVGSFASFGLFGSKSGTETIAMISPVRTSVITPAAATALNLPRAAISSSRIACSARRSTASCTGSCRRSVAHFLGVEVRHHGREQFDRFVHVDQALWLAGQRRGLDVGAENLVIAIQNVGPRRRNRIGRARAPGRMAVRLHRIEHKPPRDD